MPPSNPYTGPIFDVQAHAIKPSMFNAMANSMRQNPALTNETANTIVNNICTELADDLRGDARLTALGRDNIQVVTINNSFPSLPGNALLNITNEMNKWMATATANNPQLIGIASIPPPPALVKAGLAPDGRPYAEKGVNIFRRAITELGLKGVLFASNYNGSFLGDASFDPYFALAHELDVPIIIHPAVEPVELQFVSRRNIPTYSGYLNDQRTTLLDLVMAGTYEKYPDLTIIATHLGGGILTGLGRFKVLSQRFPTDSWFVDLEGNRRLLPRPINDYLKKIYYDCNNAEVVDVVHAASVVGADHLLTGTDFPWTDDSFSREILGHLEPSLKTKIAYENAARLFGHASLPLSEAR